MNHAGAENLQTLEEIIRRLQDRSDDDWKRTVEQLLKLITGELVRHEMLIVWALDKTLPRT